MLGVAAALGKELEELQRGSKPRLSALLNVQFSWREKINIYCPHSFIPVPQYYCIKKFHTITDGQPLGGRAWRLEA